MPPLKRRTGSSSSRGEKTSSLGCNAIAVVNIGLVLTAVYFYINSKDNLNRAGEWLERAQALAERATRTGNELPATKLATEIEAIAGRVDTHTTPSSTSTIAHPVPCDDPIWCSVEMPVKSYYKFEPPTDKVRWRIAQGQAARGEQVLLQRISKMFPSPWNTFLDGDKSFRGLHHFVDIFVDSKQDLNLLLPGKQRRRLSSPVDEEETGSAAQNPLVLDANEDGKLDTYKLSVVPPPYDFREAERAPIMQLGYCAFRKDTSAYFRGSFLSFVGGLSQLDFLQAWDKIKDKIDVPFITMVALNENWGWLASWFPNRTAAWGRCCDQPKHTLLHKFLDHPKTLMLVVGQHSNISHPKILTLPRGLPLTSRHTEQLVWDIQRNVLKEKTKKSKLLMAAASSWGPRPQILRCISEKFTPLEFEGHVLTPKTEMQKTRDNRQRYYEKLASSHFGLCLPGLGYDTFRLWEMLTVGTVAVIEKGVGFDRTLWRLPALLLDDFYEVTPALLRSAYVEALYRVDEFEYERLTQQFWQTVLANVSKSMSTQPLLDKFPMAAEDAGFTRPREPYACGKTGTCGKGTKRTPKQSC